MSEKSTIIHTVRQPKKNQYRIVDIHRLIAMVGALLQYSKVTENTGAYFDTETVAKDHKQFGTRVQRSSSNRT